MARLVKALAVDETESKLAKGVKENGWQHQPLSIHHLILADSDGVWEWSLMPVFRRWSDRGVSGPIHPDGWCWCLPPWVDAASFKQRASGFLPREPLQFRLLDESPSSASQRSAEDCAKFSHLA